MLGGHEVVIPLYTVLMRCSDVMGCDVIECDVIEWVYLCVCISSYSHYSIDSTTELS
jgi:hypothetical protein